MPDPLDPSDHADHVLRVIRGSCDPCITGNNNIGIKKCTTIFLWFDMLEKSKKFSRIFKNTLVERVFEKMVSNLSILEGIFEAEFQS